MNEKLKLWLLYLLIVFIGIISLMTLISSFWIIMFVYILGFTDYMIGQLLGLGLFSWLLYWLWKKLILSIKKIKKR